MMLYLLLPVGTIDWDDIRIFTSFAHVETLATPGFYVLAYEGIDELRPVWIYQREGGFLRRYPVSTRLPSGS
jgi:hypothetical protein